MAWAQATLEPDCRGPILGLLVPSCVTLVSLSHLNYKEGITRVPTSKGCCEKAMREVTEGPPAHCTAHIGVHVMPRITQTSCR